MEPLFIAVRGCTPKPWGTNEWGWRKAVADAARLAYPPGSLPAPAENTGYQVTIIFWLTQTQYRLSDLDNLAKPVLDTLFRPNNPQVKDLSLTGALFDVDDQAVTRLIVEKGLVADVGDEGADITIGWTSS